MTQEDKKLLLKDLCARVPYHPKGRIVNACNGFMCDEWLTCATFTMFTNITNNSRLYLRPMSSMTEKEKEYYYDIMGAQPMWASNACELIDWLNKHHFDYRGLIEKGLAIEALEDMYK